MSKKILGQKTMKVAILFILLFALSLFIWAVPVKASTAAELAVQIAAVEGIDASADGDVVTVTGENGGSGNLDFNDTLELDIDENVRVNWETTLQSSSSLIDTLIEITGDGIFAVTANGYVSHTNSGRTISSSGQKAHIRVEDGGVVSANSGSAIYMEGQNAAVIIINGGSVYSDATTNAQAVIHMTYGRNAVTDTDINTQISIDNGAVATILDDGNAYAIQTYGDITMTHEAKVFAEGSKAARAINALGPTSAVRLFHRSIVWSETGIAIHTREPEAYVGIIDSALVYNEATSSTHPVIKMDAAVNADANNIYIGVNAKVQAKNDTVNAIETEGTALLQGNPEVSATTGYAIKGKTIIDGGIAFAYGESPDDVIQNGEYTINSDEGAVVAWNKDVGTREYIQDTTTDLTYERTSSNVKWMKNVDEDGIGYGTDKFFALALVTVNVPTITILAIENETVIEDLEYNKEVSCNYTYPTGAVTTFSATGLPTGLTIDSTTGKITGTPTTKGVYNIVITATSGSITDSEGYTLTVLSEDEGIPVIGVTLNKDKLSLKKGESENLIATVMPENASNKGVIWISSDPSIVTVDENGKITAIKEGTATITVITKEGELTDSCEVSVNLDDVTVPAEEQDEKKPDTLNPETGDNSNMTLWISMLIASSIGLIGMIIYGKVQKKKKEV